MKWLVGLTAASLLLAAAPPALAQTAGPFGTMPSVPGETLATMTGQADIAEQIRANNSGIVAGNIVEGESVTGDISFGASAFANLNGLSVLSANSGNNVAINSSLNVNVAVRP
jgi:hypothetical protein